MGQELPKEFEKIRTRCLSAGMRSITFTFLVQLIGNSYPPEVKEHPSLMAARCIETIIQELSKSE
tara:strand:+ start:2457 stop:2651 length:195 start_codon:yes stop_codon:yes gene_type:complete